MSCDGRSMHSVHHPIASDSHCIGKKSVFKKLTVCMSLSSSVFEVTNFVSVCSVVDNRFVCKTQRQAVSVVWKQRNAESVLAARARRHRMPEWTSGCHATQEAHKSQIATLQSNHCLDHRNETVTCQMSYGRALRLEMHGSRPMERMASIGIHGR